MNKLKGRGVPAKYKWTTLANRSSNQPIEHLVWSLPSSIARARLDLYSTLGAAIAGAIRSIASARRHDASTGDATQPAGGITDARPSSGVQARGAASGAGGDKHTWRTVRLYSAFFRYLAEADNSPLKPSLATLKLKNDRWNSILTAPYFRGHEELDSWVDEATKMCKTLEVIARQL